MACQPDFFDGQIILSIFTKHPSEALRLEDERLNNMAKETSVKFKAGCYKF
jgi:hypothetical protein